jgi:hypothetical protein
VALIIKYKFHDETSCDNTDKSKKRRIITDVKRSNVVDYSYLKLPALMFGQYLDQECQEFIDDCIR